MLIRLPFIAIALLWIFNSSCSNKCPGATTIPAGEITSSWVYENKELGFRLQLPQHWYVKPGGYPWATLIDSVKPESFVIVKNIQLKEMGKGYEPAPAPMYTLFTFDTEQIHSPYSRGITVSLALMASENQQEAGDLQLLKTFVNSLKNIQTKTDGLQSVTLPTGNGTIRGVSYELTVGSNKMGSRLVLIKNYGCYNLAIFASYRTEAQLESIKTILATANTSK